MCQMCSNTQHRHSEVECKCSYVFICVLIQYIDILKFNTSVQIWNTCVLRKHWQFSQNQVMWYRVYVFICDHMCSYMFTCVDMCSDTEYICSYEFRCVLILNTFILMWDVSVCHSGHNGLTKVYTVIIIS